AAVGMDVEPARRVAGTEGRELHRRIVVEVRQELEVARHHLGARGARGEERSGQSEPKRPAQGHVDDSTAWWSRPFTLAAGRALRKDCAGSDKRSRRPRINERPAASWSPRCPA